MGVMHLCSRLQYPCFSVVLCLSTPFHVRGKPYQTGMLCTRRKLLRTQLPKYMLWDT